MPKTQQVGMGKATQKDVDDVLEFLQKLEEMSDDLDRDPCDLGEWVIENFHNVYGKYERILFGFSTTE